LDGTRRSRPGTSEWTSRALVVGVAQPYGVAISGACQFVCGAGRGSRFRLGPSAGIVNEGETNLNDHSHHRRALQAAQAIARAALDASYLALGRFVR